MLPSLPCRWQGLRGEPAFRDRLLFPVLSSVSPEQSRLSLTSLHTGRWRMCGPRGGSVDKLS